MVYRIVIMLALGGEPQAFVGKQEFPTLVECNTALLKVHQAVRGNWAATCQPEQRA